VESKLTRAQLQSWNNFIRALRVKELDTYVNFISSNISIKSDRVILPCNKEIEQILDSRKDFTRDTQILKKAHPNAYASWRENVTLYSMQLCLGYYGDELYKLDVDCDYGRPFYDVVGWSVHIYEVIHNSITGEVTDPFKVRKAWNNRGYDIPLISEAL